MSLKVTAREHPREFDVMVGELKVGRVVAYRSGSFACYRLTKQPDGSRAESHIPVSANPPRTLRDAVRRVLFDAGFGRPDGFVRDAMRRVR